jgi:hypothetical protein
VVLFIGLKKYCKVNEQPNHRQKQEEQAARQRTNKQGTSSLSAWRRRRATLSRKERQWYGLSYSYRIVSYRIGVHRAPHPKRERDREKEEPANPLLSGTLEVALLGLHRCCAGAWHCRTQWQAKQPTTGGGRWQRHGTHRVWDRGSISNQARFRLKKISNWRIILFSSYLANIIQSWTN